MSFVDARKSRRFSQMYLERGAPLMDSRRMRLRISAVLPKSVEKELKARLRRETGQAPSGNSIIFWDRWYIAAPVHDVLDSISLEYELLMSRRSSFPHYEKEAKLFLTNVARIFLEENVPYRVDQNGVVHYSVDQEFERAMRSVIRGLDAARYQNALQSYERVQRELDRIPPDGKEAIRAAFGSVEALFKLMFPRAPRLGGAEIDQAFRPKLSQHFGSPADQRASTKLLCAFKDWVEACHFYRHEQGQEDPAQPPLDLAIALVSSGSSYLRWLADLDQEFADVRE